MILFLKLAVAFTFLAGFPAEALEVTDENTGSPYGVDCSFPIHYKNLRCNDLLPHQNALYEEFMNGCYAKYGHKHCDSYEDDRIKMSLEQPASMVNYTSTGFKKIRAPEALYNLLKSHFDRNYEKMKEEKWPKGNIYVNHWKSPTYMINVEDTEMEGGSIALKNEGTSESDSNLICCRIIFNSKSHKYSTSFFFLS